MFHVPIPTIMILHKIYYSRKILFLFAAGDFPAGACEGYCFMRTGLKTLTASYAFRAVRVLNGIDSHGTCLCTRTALCTDIFIDIKPYEADLLEECINSAKRTHVFAERPGYEY